LLSDPVEFVDGFQGLSERDVWNRYQFTPERAWPSNGTEPGVHIRPPTANELYRNAAGVESHAGVQGVQVGA
jgi:hypothetical protein